MDDVAINIVNEQQPNLDNCRVCAQPIKLTQKTMLIVKFSHNVLIKQNLQIDGFTRLSETSKLKNIKQDLIESW